MEKRHQDSGDSTTHEADSANTIKTDARHHFAKVVIRIVETGTSTENYIHMAILDSHVTVPVSDQAREVHESLIVLLSEVPAAPSGLGDGHASGGTSSAKQLRESPCPPH